MSAELATSPSGIWSSKDPITTAREELYGPSSPSASGVPGTTPLMFSYAPPEAVKQAKLESLQLRMDQSLKDVMARLSTGKVVPDAHAGRYSSRPSESSSTRAAEQLHASAEAGGIDQFTAWVQPPSTQDDGRELNSTSKLIVKGQKQVYQHLQPSSRMRGMVQVDYDMPPEETEQTPKSRHGRGQTHGNSFGGASPTRRLNKQTSVAATARDADPTSKRAMEQLRHSLTLSFVPVDVSTEGVPSKALMSSSHVYEAARGIVDRARATTRRSQAGRSTVTQSSTWKGFVNGDGNPAAPAGGNGVTVTEENLSVVLKGDGYQLHVDAKEKQLKRLGSHKAAAAAAAGAAAGAASGEGSSTGAGAGAQPASPRTGDAMPAGTSLARPGTQAPAQAQQQQKALQGLSRQGSTAATIPAQPPVAATSGVAAATVPAQLGQSVQGILGRQGQGIASAPVVPQKQRAQSAQPTRSRPLPASFQASLGRPPVAPHKVASTSMRSSAGAEGLGTQTVTGSSGGAPGVAASERLSKANCLAMAPTRKTMARCRSGRLFSQTNKHAELFSTQTPSIALLEAASAAKRREDLQYRVLEYRALQVHSGDTVYVSPSSTGAGAAGDASTATAAASAQAGLTSTAPRTRPDSAPPGALGTTMPATSRPPSAVPVSLLRSASQGTARPTSAASTFSTANSRPSSAAASTAAKRVRPPSAGAWVGRPRSASPQPWEQEMAALDEDGWDYSTQSSAVTMLTAGGVTIQLPGSQR